MTHSLSCIRLLMAMLCALAWTAPVGVAQAESCVVANTLDSASVPPDPDSLRDCLGRARNGDTITFDPTVFDLVNSDAATTISVGSGLPALDDGNVTIDASDRRVTINGSGAGSANGLEVASSGNTIRGLAIIGFASSGIRISASGNQIGGNRTVGGGPNGQGLRISGNGTYGLEITGAGTTSNVVKGCWIGLDSSGLAAEPNDLGVAIGDGAGGNTIGSPIPYEGNVISGNKFEGLTISGVGTDDNVIIGNVIGQSGGVDATGRRSAIGNGSAGLFLSRGTGTRIGGTGAGESNVIANNGGNGIEVRSSDSRRNSARGNKISRNKSGGIALFDNANDGIAPPSIQSVEVLGPNSTGTGTTLRVSGSTPQAGDVEVFNDTGSQGETFRATVVSSGSWSADVDVDAIQNVTATVTDGVGNTSQFGAFGITDGDTDGDGFSDEIEGLVGTDPDDDGDVWDDALESLDVAKAQINLNFAKTDKDKLAVKANVSLPPGFVPAGAHVGVVFAGQATAFTLDEKGKGETGNAKIGLKLTKAGTYLVHVRASALSLRTEVAPFGLTDETTPKDGKRWLLPVVITVGETVYTAPVQLTYKAKQGKTGKAK